jgi:general secretion pathway protein M
MIKRIWKGLTMSQKYYLLGGGIFVVGVLVVQFAVVPLIETKKKVHNSITANEKVLREVSSLASEYNIFKQRSDEIQKALARRPQNFALFSYLERKADETGLKQNIKSMNPSKMSSVGAYEETSVEIKLEKITLKQLTSFLYSVESPQDIIRTKKMSVNKMKESPEYLSALLQVITYQPLRAERGKL